MARESFGAVVLALWRWLLWRWLCIACPRIAIGHLFCSRCQKDPNRWRRAY